MIYVSRIRPWRSRRVGAKPQKSIVYFAKKASFIPHLGNARNLSLYVSVLERFQFLLLLKGI
ncbi:hypothetical protein ACQFX9_23235 [Aliinostoc sp. HNIBRCY26]|uniref:hypothetical protein n=1 Tax=Aliinostoc sp. HNIBRCY26 TaxID=3418997 RepID=UPI003D044F90